MCLLNRGYVRTIAHTSRTVTKELNDIRQRKIRTNREEIYNYFAKLNDLEIVRYIVRSISEIETTFN